MRILQLEWKRFNKRPYIIACLGLTAFSLFAALLFLFLPESELDAAEFADNWEQLTAFVSCLTMAGFSILGAVMNAKMILEEYTGKRVLLLFSYPVPRTEMFRAKACITWGMTAVMALLSNTTAMVIAGILSRLFHGMEETFDAGVFLITIIYSLGMGMTAGCVGIIALWFGFWKSSVPVCIVSSLIIVTPVTNMFGANIFLRGLFVIVTAVMLIIGLGVYQSLKNKAKNMEVL